jgi:NAD(P)H-nitrite reductase large subunit
VQLDDLICYCYRVPLRKLVHFARRERPRLASQMSACLGAGTGCGWCIPFLKRIHADPDRFPVEELTAEAYAEARQRYLDTQAPRNSFEPPPP